MFLVWCTNMKIEDVHCIGAMLLLQQLSLGGAEEDADGPSVIQFDNPTGMNPSKEERDDSGYSKYAAQVEKTIEKLTLQQDAHEKQLIKDAAMVRFFENNKLRASEFPVPSSSNQLQKDEEFPLREFWLNSQDSEMDGLLSTNSYKASKETC